MALTPKEKQWPSDYNGWAGIPPWWVGEGRGYQRKSEATQEELGQGTVNKWVIKKMQPCWKPWNKVSSNQRHPTLLHRSSLYHTNIRSFTTDASHRLALAIWGFCGWNWILWVHRSFCFRGWRIMHRSLPMLVASSATELCPRNWQHL